MKLPHNIIDGNVEDVLACARLADRAYERTQLGTFTAGSDHGFISWDESVVVIAIAGSDDLADWISNGKCWGSPVQVGTQIGHHGIVEGAAAVARELIHQPPPTDRPWLIVGHSRGGGIAHWLPELYRCPQDTCVVTFGAPRCSRGIVRPSHVRRRSYVLPGDPVTLLPLWTRGWRDPGDRLYLFASGIDDEWPLELAYAAWRATQLAGVYAANRALGLAKAVDASAKWLSTRHMMRHYIDRLELLAGGAA